MKLDKKTIGLVTLALPLVVMAGMVGINHHHMNNTTEYRFAIEGYDPRDLLRGHFMTFNYSWPEDRMAANACADAETCCACISGDPLNPDMSFVVCEDIPELTCGAQMPVMHGWNYQPEQEARQVYISEEHALELDRRLRAGENEFSVGIVGSPARVKELYIDGKPVREFVKDMPPVREAR